MSMQTVTLPVPGSTAGADPGFQVRGGALKKNCAERREALKYLGYFVWKITILRKKIIFFPIAEGGAKIFGVFRVKNHDFTQKNHIFSNCGGRRENLWGISCEKSRFYAKESYFYPILGGGSPPPSGSAPVLVYLLFSYLLSTMVSDHSKFTPSSGADPGGAPPLKLEKIWFFGVKSWFFTRNTPRILALPSARRNFF
jgi:hypothetical protein